MYRVFESEVGIIREIAPTNPPNGQRSLYPKEDGWYDLDSSGVENKISLVADALCEVKMTTYTLTSADILSMFTTPILVIPGVPGKIIQIANMVSIFYYGGIPYSGGGTVRIIMENGFGAQSATLTAAELAGSVDVIHSGVGSGTNKTAGLGITATNAGSPFLGGNGTIKHIITYQYITI